jgi:hypothetical protein
MSKKDLTDTVCERGGCEEVTQDYGEPTGSYFLIMKANEMHYFSYLFDKVLHMFQTGPLSIIRNISTLYTHNRYLSF